MLSDAVKSRLVQELRQVIIDQAEDRRLTAGIRSPEEVETAVAKALKWQTDIRELLARTDLARGMVEAGQLLLHEGIQLDDASPEYARFARDVMVGMAAAYGIISHHEQGIFYDLNGPRPVTVAISDQSDGVRTVEQVQQDKAHMRMPFSVHAKAFKDVKVTTKKWGWDHRRDADAAYALFQELVGDKSIAHYTADDATDFVRLLTRLPVGVNQYLSKHWRRRRFTRVDQVVQDLLIS